MQPKSDSIAEQVKILEAAFLYSSDAKFVVDNFMRVWHLNESALKLLGKEEDVTGKKLVNLVPKENTSRLKVLMNELMTNKTLHQVVTLKLGTSHYYYDVTARANIVDRRHLLVFRDVTAKHMEAETRSQFIAVAGHEIKTPLAVSMAYTDLLTFKYKHDKKLLKYLNKIQEKNIVLRRYIESIIDEIKIGAGKFSYTDKKHNFERIVKKAVSEIVSMNPKRKIEVIGNLTRTEVLVDQSRITQVIQNLLTNAIKHSPESKPITINYKNSDKGVLLSITDRGQGISVREQSQIFRPFYRNTKNDNLPGLGLGLYISNQIIRRYGGTLNVHSRKRKGATFYFEIPNINSY